MEGRDEAGRQYEEGNVRKEIELVTTCAIELFYIRSMAYCGERAALVMNIKIACKFGMICTSRFKQLLERVDLESFPQY